MSTNRKTLHTHFYTPDEYFALEHAGDARYEYWDGDVVCMSGGSREHGLISTNIILSLGLALRGGKCRAFTSDTAVKTPTLPPYRYPDASVACGELRYENIRGVDALINPVLIVEVLSPSSAERDRESKFVAYRAIETFGAYLLVAQDTPHVTLYARLPGGDWARRDVTDPEASLALDAVGCTLSMRDIYEGVTFNPAG